MDEGELSQVLGEQFRLLGYNMKSRFTLPSALKPLANGGDAVVLVRLVRGNLRIAEFDELDIVKADNKLLQMKVKAQAEEIKALNILLEKEKEKEEPTPEEKFADIENYPTPNIETETEKAMGTSHLEEKPKKKPKRKRKKSPRKEVTEE